MANAVQAQNIKKTRCNSKKKKPNEILEHLKRLVTDTTASDEDDDPSPSSSMSHFPFSLDNEVAKIVCNIFKCSICLDTSKLPAAACASCYAVIGCIPCIEQWYESSGNDRVKCPLCRTTAEYHIIPLLREISTLLQQPIPEHRSTNHSTLNLSDTESLDTIPYGDSEGIRNEGGSDDELPVVLE